MKTVLPDLVLASASPRRRELLAQIGVRHVVRVANVDETPHPGELPAAYVERLARAKAQAVFERLNNEVVTEVGLAGLPVLGADTSVMLDGKILGKPENDTDALHMLRAMSGRTHEVLTAIALVNGASTATRVSVTLVSFRACDDAFLAKYISTGEPHDKAGAYGIQGAGAALVTHIDGSYSGVVGLPIEATVDLLLAAGMTIWRDIPAAGPAS